MRFPACRDGWIDVREDVTNVITCTDFSDTDTITWSILQKQVFTEVATCGPSGCTNHSSDIGAVRMTSENKTQLFYPPRGREGEQYTLVSCVSNKAQTSQRTTSCMLNVISMAYQSVPC